ncbi:MAG: SRPBCC domain-containing protein [Candidatus Sulfotelmatobacter sp.]
MATVAITPDQNTVTGEIFIAAPPARVFQALTDPAQVPRWWGARDMYRVTKWKGDLRVGGEWSSSGVGADGKEFTVSGEYLEIDPPRLLAHTWRYSWGGANKTVVRFELEPKSVHGLHPAGPQRAGTGTLLRITHEGFAPDAAAAAGHSEGWKRVLGWLVAYVEKGETIDTRH